MRRVLLTVTTAGILTAVTATDLPAHTAQIPSATQRMQGGDLMKVNSTPPSPAVISNTPASVSPTKLKPELEDEGSLNTFSTLLTSLIVMATIAFRRTRSRKL